MRICGILLAAGFGRRFGSNKLLFPLEGKPMFLHGAQKLRRLQETPWGGDLDLCVVTQYEEVARQAEKLGFQVLFNAHPGEGLASSIQVGIQGNPGYDGYLLMAADQPWIRLETLRGLLEVFFQEKKGIACVSVKGRIGNPSIFAEKYREELLMLHGDVGGKQIIAAHREDTVLYRILEERELEDIDRR